MCVPVAVAGLIVSAVGTAASIYQGVKSSQAQSRAAAEAKRQFAETKAANTRAINAANQKTPDLAAIAGMARANAGGGVGSTMLTGPGGVSAGTLQLGKNTLLGQ